MTARSVPACDTANWGFLATIHVGLVHPHASFGFSPDVPPLWAF